MASHATKLIGEKEWIDNKISALGAFLGKDKPDAVPQDEWDLLNQQLMHMCEYSATLGKRIALNLK